MFLKSADEGLAHSVKERVIGILTWVGVHLRWLVVLTDVQGVGVLLLRLLERRVLVCCVWVHLRVVLEKRLLRLLVRRVGLVAHSFAWV